MSARDDNTLVNARLGAPGHAGMPLIFAWGLDGGIDQWRSELDAVGHWWEPGSMSECDGLLIADIDPGRAKPPMDPGRTTIGKPWSDMLEYYRKNGYIKWME